MSGHHIDKILIKLGDSSADVHMILLSGEILTLCSRIVLATVLVERI